MTRGVLAVLASLVAVLAFAQKPPKPTPTPAPPESPIDTSMVEKLSLIHI